MKRNLLVGGSVGAVVLLVLAMLPSVVSSNAKKEQNIDQIIHINYNKNELKKLIEELKESWIPGLIIGILALMPIILLLIASTIAQLLNDWLIRY